MNDQNHNQNISYSSTTIQYIAVFSRNKHYATYIINNSVELHAMKYDDLYKFLNNYITADMRKSVREFFYHYKSFFIDIRHNIIQELQINEKTYIDKLKKDIKAIKYTKIKNELKNLSDCNKHDMISYFKDYDKIIKNIYFLNKDKN